MHFDPMHVSQEPLKRFTTIEPKIKLINFNFDYLQPGTKTKMTKTAVTVDIQNLNCVKYKHHNVSIRHYSEPNNYQSQTIFAKKTPRSFLVGLNQSSFSIIG